MNSRVSVVISGRVQGVWFRASTKQKAEELGITGCVKNTVDGDVEAIFEGEEELIREMLDWCRSGSSYAKVTDVKVNPGKYVGEFDEFSIVY